MRTTARRAIAIAGLAGVLVAASGARSRAQVRFADASDREAFRAWFVLLADAQFYRPTPDVSDCAALVRHAVREALRPHTPEWVRLARLPVARLAPDVRARADPQDGALRLFRVSPEQPLRYGEFADARTIVRHNAHSRGRDTGSLRPGDLLYFRQPRQSSPDHLMLYVGRSAFEPDHDDWVVYHTGPSRPEARSGVGGHAGEVRKVRLSDLVRHPSARWRPVAGNASFIGVFRLDMLEAPAPRSRRGP
jgi:uncharacterized protein YfaT (DUF1175 family)